VSGLCGGAGATTLAYLTALAATRATGSPVLVADTGGPSGALASYAGVAAPRSMVEVAELVATGLPTGRLVASTRDGLRVLATGPRMVPACAREGIEVLVDHARERYALTVIDCGTLAREPDQLVLAKATHVAWVLPATAGAVKHARPVLETTGSHTSGAQVIVARRDHRDRPGVPRDLKHLAQDHHAALVLMPSVPDLAGTDAGRALDAAQIALQAILGVLAR
jgi:Flp pilus assembly CpaE family ATPase